MRSLFLVGVLWCSALLRAAEVPAELASALDALQTNAPFGWAFTQTSTAQGKERVERFEPIGPEPARWRLLQVDGREPSQHEKDEYRKGQVLAAGGEPVPNVKNQIDRASAEKISDDGDRATWRFRLVPGPNDRWASHMAATFTLHRPTGVIERVELAAIAPFSPIFFTQIDEARTIMQYSLPEADRPALLELIQVRVRGRAWAFRSLNSDMTVRFYDYRYVGKR